MGKRAAGRIPRREGVQAVAWGLQAGPPRESLAGSGGAGNPAAGPGVGRRRPGVGEMESPLAMTYSPGPLPAEYHRRWRA